MLKYYGLAIYLQLFTNKINFKNHGIMRAAWVLVCVYATNHGCIMVTGFQYPGNISLKGVSMIVKMLNNWLKIA